MGQPGALGPGLSGPSGLSAAAQGWSRLHHGIDPTRVPMLRGWLRLVWALARPLARTGLPPTALTVVGVVFALDAVLLADRLPGVASALVLASALCDGLDGAVAAIGGWATRSGALADMVADRIADTAFAAVLWRCGAPWWLAAFAAAASLGQELLRLRWGGRALTTITVAERPTRVICGAVGALVSALGVTGWPQVVCGAVWLGLAAVGFGQLLRTRRPGTRGS